MVGAFRERVRVRINTINEKLWTHNRQLDYSRLWFRLYCVQVSVYVQQSFEENHLQCKYAINMNENNSSVFVFESSIPFYMNSEWKNT